MLRIGIIESPFRRYSGPAYNIYIYSHTFKNSYVEEQYNESIKVFYFSFNVINVVFETIKKPNHC